MSTLITLSSPSPSSLLSWRENVFSLLDIEEHTEIKGKVKRKRIDTRKTRPERYVRPHVGPRILKNDMRRFYGAMFVNVMNSQDNEFMRSFFEKYAYKEPFKPIDEVEFGSHCWGDPSTSCNTASTSSVSSVSQLSGPLVCHQKVTTNALIDNSTATLDYIPDIVVRLESCGVRQKANGTSVVVCRTTFEGTLLDVPKLLSRYKYLESREFKHGMKLFKTTVFELFLNADNQIYEIGVHSAGWFQND